MYKLQQLYYVSMYNIQTLYEFCERIVVETRLDKTGNITTILFKCYRMIYMYVNDDFNEIFSS